MRTIQRLLAVVMGLGIWFAAPAYATLTIEITQGTEGALPIAIVPFAWEGSTPPPEDVSGVIASDLRRSGRFAPLPDQDLISRPHEGAQVRFADWRALNVENLLVGRVKVMGPGMYVVQFQLFDVYKGVQMAGYSIPANKENLRRTAHHVADIVYETLTGQRGAFNTRIAYVVALPPGTDDAVRYQLQVADSDGYAPNTILRSPQPLMSPSWSPDGTRLAYVSFENKAPEIFVQDVNSGQRRSVSRFKGINGAPAWSPDGRRLAVTLSQKGNPDIYTLDIGSGQVQQLTHSFAIDTEPAWTPDGKHIAFTSDRGGKPQIYQIAVSGGKPQRLTFEGEYNARPAFSPDGKQLVFVNGQQNKYRVAIMELENKILRILTDGTLDESPSFAPNGSMLLYATRDRGRGLLAAVSVDGRVHQRLVPQAGDVREPAWSPFEQR
ncbi:MAG: Tol-Pal system beta propeller repeat protein TolB [Proteobacteria bacterium]|nr:MAG: Tol-Pal system beta propeller repeat protein TolB [Pseudomonadota bacterium]QKK11917.1 MAG: Tol-Pal system beta propeller repeat protein TolB [Pseudomonadota bacterium]